MPSVIKRYFLRNKKKSLKTFPLKLPGELLSPHPPLKKISSVNSSYSFKIDHTIIYVIKTYCRRNIVQ